jgi:hypothetical protein
MRLNHGIEDGATEQTPPAGEGDSPRIILEILEPVLDHQSIATFTIHGVLTMGDGDAAVR